MKLDLGTRLQFKPRLAHRLTPRLGGRILSCFTKGCLWSNIAHSLLDSVREGLWYSLRDSLSYSLGDGLLASLWRRR